MDGQQNVKICTYCYLQPISQLTWTAYRSLFVFSKG